MKLPGGSPRWRAGTAASTRKADALISSWTRACEAAAMVLTAALGEGAATEQDADRLIKKYPVIRRRLEKLHEHFEVVGEPLPRENGKRSCPACLCYVSLCDNYCRWCGKPIRVRKRGLKRAKDK